MSAEISIIGNEINYEGDEKGWVKIPTRLQVFEDTEYPGMEGYLFSYEYKKNGNHRYLTRFTIIAYESTIEFDRFQDEFGIATEITGKTNNNGNFRVGINPQENGKYRLFVARGVDSINEFEITKFQFEIMETYLRQMKG